MSERTRKQGKVHVKSRRAIARLYAAEDAMWLPFTEEEQNMKTDVNSAFNIDAYKWE
ncbi:hypothetical protein [Paenibacillus luteus]|uniref:hypothetical protein n=1 Tax=Paenibacillus luteus TaxID=2545753 RepID=UPI001375B7C6|nr:hypothetical protein [Paenibacillus luteus]